jgi:hypothetical protein
MLGWIKNPQVKRLFKNAWDAVRLVLSPYDKNMNKQTILKIMAFLERATLTGQEVLAYNECIQELNIEFTKEEKLVEQKWEKE